MPNTLYRKIKRHLENNQVSESVRTGQDKLINDLPQSLASAVLEITHGQIVARIHFLKNKPQDFLKLIMMQLKPLKLLKGDMLYQERDYANEIYFIQQGKFKLHVDIQCYLNEDKQKNTQGEEEEEEEDEEDEEEAANKIKNIGFIAYIEGSHFGDVDICGKQASQTRDSTAIATCESHLFVMSFDEIKKLARTHRTEIDELDNLAETRRKVHKALLNQLKSKVVKIKQRAVEEGAENFNQIDFELQLMMIDEFQLVEKHDKENQVNARDSTDSRILDVGVGTRSERLRTFALADARLTS